MTDADQIAVRVRTAIAPTPEESGRLARILRARFGAALALEYEVDPDVLGGVWVQIGDTVVDGSLAGKLGTLREQLVRETSLVC